MKMDLTNKTAFVAEGSKGFGKAIAEVLAACGANVGVMARGENWRHIIGINLDCVAFAMMFVIEEMLKAGGGSIVNIASVEAHTLVRESPRTWCRSTRSSGLTKATASDYAHHGIRINTVSPGMIATPLIMADGQKEVTDRLATRIPLGRISDAAEIASALAFIL